MVEESLERTIESLITTEYYTIIFDANMLQIFLHGVKHILPLCWIEIFPLPGHGNMTRIENQFWSMLKRFLTVYELSVSNVVIL